MDNALDGEGLNDADNYPGFWEGRVMNNISFIRRGSCFRRAIKVSWLKLGIWTNGGPGRSSSQTFHECTCFSILEEISEKLNLTDLGVWKMRNMMTVTMRMTERLHSCYYMLLCYYMLYVIIIITREVALLPLLACATAPSCLLPACKKCNLVTYFHIFRLKNSCF